MTPPIEKDLEDDFEVSSIPWRSIAILWFLLFGFLPMTTALGLARFLPGPAYWGMKSVFDPFIYFAFYLFLLYAGLIWPVTTLAFPQVERLPTRLMRILAMTALLSPPLLSYAYYKGGIKDVRDFGEMVISLVIPAFLSASLFERTRRSFVVLIFLGISTYLPLFLLSDIFSDIPTLLRYASSAGSFYLWRSLFPFAALGYGVAELILFSKSHAMSRAADVT